MRITLNKIEKIWRELNREIFAAALMPLQDIPHRRTRTKDYWACHDTDAGAYYWAYSLHEFSGCLRSLIFHEMVHQWQDEYLPDYMPHGYNPHDLYFFGWAGTAKRNNLILSEKM